MTNEERIMRYYLEGMHILDITKRCDITSQGVYYVLNKNKVPRKRHRGDSKKLIFEKAYQEYNKGKKTIPEICKKYKIHINTFYNWQRRLR